MAQRVGLLFESLGLLAGAKVVACSASDLVTGYANQAAGKTREVFDSALGQVLFIDEAYRCVACAAGAQHAAGVDGTGAGGVIAVGQCRALECCAGVQQLPVTTPAPPVQAQPSHRRALHE